MFHASTCNDHLPVDDLSKPRTPSAPPEQAATADDAELFRQALADVTSLKPSDRITPSVTRKPLAVVQTRMPRAEVADTLSDHLPSAEPLNEYLGNGLSRMTLRKLRRGMWPPQEKLDLHGLNTDDARKLLVNFLHEALQHNLRSVEVIHGKGHHSEGRASILKSLTRHWLTQHSQVLAFCEAPHYAGGSGAVWVLLKNQAEQA